MNARRLTGRPKKKGAPVTERPMSASLHKRWLGSNAYAAALALPAIGTDEIVFKIREAIW